MRLLNPYFLTLGSQGPSLKGSKGEVGENYRKEKQASRKVIIKYVGPLALYKIVDLHNTLLMNLDGKHLRGLFEHELLKPATIRTNQGNVTTLASLKHILSLGMLIQ